MHKGLSVNDKEWTLGVGAENPIREGQKTQPTCKYPIPFDLLRPESSDLSPSASPVSHRMGPVSVVDWFLMNFVLRPWQFFFLILCGWVNRQQQEVIEFQNAQIQVLLDKMGRKRILLTDDQRRVLAVKGKALWAAER